MTKEEAINTLITDSDSNKISDGYHTFGELYNHRTALYIALCKSIVKANHIYGPDVWRSHKHSDGSVIDGWFVLGITKISGEQITYHLPVEKWDDCDFAKMMTLAPEFDGHSSEDVLNRLANL